MQRLRWSFNVQESPWNPGASFCHGKKRLSLPDSRFLLDEMQFFQRCSNTFLLDRPCDHAGHLPQLGGMPAHSDAGPDGAEPFIVVVRVPECIGSFFWNLEMLQDLLNAQSL